MDREAGLVRSTRLESGIPLGGLGTGAFHMRPDGGIGRITFNGNWDRPIPEAPGAFAALWTNAGGRMVTRSLRLKDPLGLPSVAGVDCRGLFPRAQLQFTDRDLPLRVSLEVFSPLVPGDLKSSSLPAALWVFRLANESRAPVEASIALSWDHLAGVGGAHSTGPIADRTGNRLSPVSLPEEGLFGLRFSGPAAPAEPPANRLPYNARAGYALFVEAPGPEAQVTTASWNVRGGAPAWWSRFSQDGTVEGQCGPGVEGRVHPAGVVAARLRLKDRETRELAFAFAWHAPQLVTLSGVEYGHYYDHSFPHAEAAARYALQNRLPLATLTAEWQQRLLRSTLPAWLSRRLISDAAVLADASVFTRDGGEAAGDREPLFALLESPGEAEGRVGALDDRLLAQPLVAALFAELDRRALAQYALLQKPEGQPPRSLGLLDAWFGGAGAEGHGPLYSDLPRPACAFVLQVCRAYRWSGDQDYLDRQYPAARRAIEHLATMDRGGDGLPDPADAASAGLWLAALQAARTLAEAIDDRRFAATCAGLFQRARAPAAALYARGGGQEGLELAGVWAADALDLGDILPQEAVSDALERAAMEQSPAWPTRTLGLAVPALITRGRADAGIALADRVDQALWAAGTPWRAPLRLDPAGAAAAGRAHMTGGASWAIPCALLGFGLDLPAGRMALAPRLPSGWRQLSAPIFAPTFWAWVSWRPHLRRADLSLRFDRFLPVAGRSARRQQGAGIMLSEFLLPDLGPAMEAAASLGRSPAPGTLRRDAQGRPLFQFTPPIRLTAGQRLEFRLILESADP